ncbi:hypothetical protein ONZ45_g18543 [Pleurotus djamor]|nr:hypothetical protein ONZ45_g18543 [Pleurotus djamor]
MPIGFKAQRLPDPSEDEEVQRKLSESPDDTTTAYGVCKQFEDHCLNSSGNPTDVAAAIASARVLGYLLIYLPPAAVAEVTRSIQSCNEDYCKKTSNIFAIYGEFNQFPNSYIT